MARHEMPDKVRGDILVSLVWQREVEYIWETFLTEGLSGSVPTSYYKKTKRKG